MPGDTWQKFANLRALYAYMFSHPGKKLNFMGGEIGQWAEWNYDASLEWYLLDSDEPRHRQLQTFVHDLNHLYGKRTQPVQGRLSPGRDSSGSTFVTWTRASFPLSAREEAGDPPIVVIANFTPVPRHNYRVGLPRPGAYQEILNSDAEQYGGSGVGNPELLEAEEFPWQGQPYSAPLTLPPLGLIYLKPQT